jgi:hypothetical protein
MHRRRLQGGAFGFVLMRTLIWLEFTRPLSDVGRRDENQLGTQRPDLVTRLLHGTGLASEDWAPGTAGAIQTSKRHSLQRHTAG